MYGCHLATPVSTSIIESELDNAARCQNGDIFDTYSRVWIKPMTSTASNDLKQFFMFRGGTLKFYTCIEILCILTNNDQIYIFIAGTQPCIGFCRPKIGIEIKFFS